MLKYSAAIHVKIIEFMRKSSNLIVPKKDRVYNKKTFDDFTPIRQEQQRPMRTETKSPSTSESTVAFLSSVLNIIQFDFYNKLGATQVTRSSY